MRKCLTSSIKAPSLNAHKEIDFLAYMANKDTSSALNHNLRQSKEKIQGDFLNDPCNSLFHYNVLEYAGVLALLQPCAFILRILKRKELDIFHISSLSNI